MLVLTNTHVEKIKNLCEQNFKGTVAHNCHDKRKKTHDKKNNLATKRKTTTSQQKKKELICPLGIEEILP